MFEVISGCEYPKKVIPLIESSKESIKIVVFDWRWYPQDPGASCQLFNQSIIRAVRRGVNIMAVANNDHVISILNNEGCKAKRLKTARLVHSKLMIIDNKIVITGSHNFTQSAFQMNLELSVILSDDSPKDSFLAFFNNLWGL